MCDACKINRVSDLPWLEINFICSFRFWNTLIALMWRMQACAKQDCYISSGRILFLRWRSIWVDLFFKTMNGTIVDLGDMSWFSRWKSDLWFRLWFEGGVLGTFSAHDVSIPDFNRLFRLVAELFLTATTLTLMFRFVNDLRMTLVVVGLHVFLVRIVSDSQIDLR